MDGSLPRTLRAFQALGFFAGRDLAEVEAEIREEWGDEVGGSGVSADLLVLVYDRDRVFHADTECDAFEGNEEYVRWIRALASIAREPLLEVEERWENGPQPRVRLTAATARGRVEAEARPGGDYLDDAAVLALVNRLLPSAGPRFRSAPTGGQDVIYVFADDATAAAIHRARGWGFEDPPAPADPPAPPKRSWWPFGR